MDGSRYSTLFIWSENLSGKIENKDDGNGKSYKTSMCNQQNDSPMKHIRYKSNLVRYEDLDSYYSYLQLRLRLAF